MKFCADHTKRINEAIEARGLIALASDMDDETSIHNKLADAHFHGLSFDNFDPLGGIVYSIARATMERFGMDAWELMLPHELGFIACPLCYLNEHCDCCADHNEIIPKAADLQVRIWRQLTP